MHVFSSQYCWNRWNKKVAEKWIAWLNWCRRQKCSRWQPGKDATHSYNVSLHFSIISVSYKFTLNLSLRPVLLLTECFTFIVLTCMVISHQDSVLYPHTYESIRAIRRAEIFPRTKKCWHQGKQHCSEPVCSERLINHGTFFSAENVFPG